MANLCCITKDMQSSKSLSDFKPYTGRLSREDVATLVETFEFALSEVPVEAIVGVLKNSNGHFAFLIDSGDASFLDFYQYLNNGYTGATEITPVNAKLMFSRALSRGIYSEYEGEEDSDTGDADEEVGTGYMDENDLSDIRGTMEFVLHYDRTGEDVPFTGKGTIIGRSAKTADFTTKVSINVSRPHAKIYLDRGKPVVEDLRSANGTYINGAALTPNKPYPVKDGDMVVLADEKFRVEVR